MALHEAQAARRKRGGDAPASSPSDSSEEMRTLEGQEKILNPESVQIKMFGNEANLYPLPAKWAFKFVGLAGRILGAAGQDRGANVIYRVGSVIAESFFDDFALYLARAMNPTNADINDAQVHALRGEMQQKLTVSDFLPVAGAFMAMAEQNGVMKALGYAAQPDAKN